MLGSSCFVEAGLYGIAPNSCALLGQSEHGCMYGIAFGTIQPSCSIESVHSVGFPDVVCGISVCRQVAVLYKQKAGQRTRGVCIYRAFKR